VNETLRTCNPLESLPSPSRQQHAVHQLGSNDLDSSVNNDASGHDRPFIRYWGSRASPIGLIMLGTIAAYFLLTEHRVHLFGALPFVLLLLACPLMHVFMHRGHGAGPRHHGGESRPLKNGGPS
jgi:hypothetical protein